MFDFRPYSSVFVLTDENVARLWLSEVCQWLGLREPKPIVIKAGEEQKNLATAQDIWAALLEAQADRHSLLVNVGGGVVTDLGGFAASCFKRGIDFVNVPTTLLAMVDAAIGGKTGVNFGGLKNQIGTFAMPKAVLCFPRVLSTLPTRAVRSGLAELLKYGLLADADLLQSDLTDYEQYINRAAGIKKAVVAEDALEKGPRKVLNFGHTLGHAIEGRFSASETPLLHGEAVAMGMCCALWISVRQCGLDAAVLQTFEAKLPVLLEEAQVSLDEQDKDAILALLVHDKKSQNGRPKFVLLEALEKPVWDVEVATATVRASLDYLESVLKR